MVVKTFASGVSFRMDAFNSSSLLKVRPAKYTSSNDIASKRALTDPMEPDAPITMVLAATFLLCGWILTKPMRRIASAAAHRAPDAE